MKTLITSENIAKLPVHDADFHSIRIDESDGGDVTLNIEIEIDPEESLEALTDIGVITRRIRLHFVGCWQVISNLLSYQSRREQVFDWQVLLDSEQLKLFRERCGSTTMPPLHHKFEFSGGSILEIIAKDVLIEGTSNVS